MRLSLAVVCDKRQYSVRAVGAAMTVMGSRSPGPPNAVLSC